MLYSSLLAYASVALAARAPLFEAADRSQRVPHSYIVKLKDVVSRAARDDTLETLSATADHVYEGGIFNGFAVTLDDKELKRLRDHPDVEYIEEDAIVTVKLEIESDDTLQERAVDDPWNLVRISHRENVGPGHPYVYDQALGNGTCIYVLDTGIHIEHPYFGGRAENVANFVGGSGTDRNGHGTAVAGITAALRVGVSRQSRVLGVKVLNDSGTGTLGSIIAGLDFVAWDANRRGCLSSGNLGGFAVFAGTVGWSGALNDVATNLVAQGHFLAADVGQDTSPLWTVSPASAVNVCSVGPTDRRDRIPAATNFGDVDMFAPGLSILSLSHRGGTALFRDLSAAAHVTGVAAYISSVAGLPANQLCNFLRQTASVDVLDTVIPLTTLLFNGGTTA